MIYVRIKKTNDYGLIAVKVTGQNLNGSSVLLIYVTYLWEKRLLQARELSTCNNVGIVAWLMMLK